MKTQKGDSEVYLLPFERSGDTSRTPEEHLFEALASDPDFAEDTQDRDESAAAGDTPADNNADDGDDEPDTPNTPNEGEDGPDGDDDDGDPDGDDGDNDSAAGEPLELDDSAEIIVDGEKVTFGELKKRGLRQADYTRKTQELANERRAFERERAENAQLRETLTARLAQVEEALSLLQPQEPDWALLRRTNPGEFAARWAEHQQRQQRIQAVQEEKRQLEQELIAERQRAFQEYIQQQRELLVEAIPEWQDAEVAKREKEELRQFAHSRGFTDEDLAGVVDHRLMVLLRDAQRFHKLTTEGKKQVQEKAAKAKVLQPGARQPRRNTKAKRVERARQRLARTGRVQDAAAAIYELLDDED